MDEPTVNDGLHSPQSNPVCVVCATTSRYVPILFVLSTCRSSNIHVDGGDPVYQLRLVNVTNEEFDPPGRHSVGCLYYERVFPLSYERPGC